MGVEEVVESLVRLGPAVGQHEPCRAAGGRRSLPSAARHGLAGIRPLIRLGDAAGGMP